MNESRKRDIALKPYMDDLRNEHVFVVRSNSLIIRRYPVLRIVYTPLSMSLSSTDSHIATVISATVARSFHV